MTKQLFQGENNEEIYIHYKNSATAFNGEKKELRLAITGHERKIF